MTYLLIIICSALGFGLGYLWARRGELPRIRAAVNMAYRKGKERGRAGK